MGPVFDATGRRLADLIRHLPSVQAFSWYVRSQEEARALPALIHELRAVPDIHGRVQFVAYGPGLDPDTMGAIAKAGGIYHGPHAFGPEGPASGADLALAVAHDVAAAVPPVAAPTGTNRASRFGLGAVDVTSAADKYVFAALVGRRSAGR
ncbi:hypothetical protein [Falsiroseomonas sp. HW251]|uniref:hypothetical protein n=1 Tax=Falsiroseomonas sp. HW251 TaxID=3390998 RepID=UPI003D3124EB